MRNIVFLFLLFHSTLSSGQNDPIVFFPFEVWPSTQDNQLGPVKYDTDYINALIDTAGIHLQRRHYLKFDSVWYYTGQAIQLSRRINYTLGEMIGKQILGWMYLYKDIPDSSKYYFKSALRLDSIRQDTANLIWHYVCLGWAHLDAIEYDSACHVFKKSYDLSVQTKDTAGIMQAVSQLARGYELSGNKLESARYTLENAHFANSVNDTSEIISSYMQLARLYSSVGLNSKYLEMTRNALKLHYGKPGCRNSYNLNYLAINAYFSIAQYDTVLYYCRKNLPRGNTFSNIPVIWFTMGNVFLEMNHLDSARYYYDKWHDQIMKTGMPVDADTYLSFGKLELKLGNKTKAIQLFNLSETSLDGHDAMTQIRVYSTLHEYYQNNQQFKLALHYLHRKNHIQDSISAKEKELNRIVDLLMAEDEKEKQILLLSQNNDLQIKLNRKKTQQQNIILGGSLLTFVLSAFSFRRYRKNRDLKSKHELANERLRISKDLHDEVGATLSGIAMYSHLAKEQINSAEPSNVKNSLDIIQESSGNMVEKLGDIVWLLNPEHDTFQKLMEKLEEYGKQMAAVKNMKVKLNLPQELLNVNLPVEARRNIYLISKEAINNAVKYSQADRLELEARIQHGVLYLSVNDNGIGFDPGSIKKGNGLGNMEKRASEIGASFQILSTPFKGTKTNLQYNLPQ